MSKHPRWVDDATITVRPDDGPVVWRYYRPTGGVDDYIYRWLTGQFLRQQRWLDVPREVRQIIMENSCPD